MSSDNQSPENVDPLEEKIFQRLRQWQDKHPNGDGPRDSELEGLVYRFLYRELRGIAAVLRGLGPQANNQQGDVSCRFTSVLHKAFVRIIEKYPDKLMQSKSRKQLTGYFSRTMSTMMLNHYKRKGTFQKIVEQLGLTEAEDAQVRDILSHLAEEKASDFEKRTGILFEKGLEVIKRWDESNDAEKNAWATALILRHVDGLGYDDIARELGMERFDSSGCDVVRQLVEQARKRVRSEAK
ncbi:MAG: hypothetical protein KDA88_23870 [Planctomycetaceae bacterium]|nr:hypothetical protein [Planctomycetaceae bacterium]MCB9952153.1 hypothetical protein [Planctomycetaceae bacterium]